MWVTHCQCESVYDKTRFFSKIAINFSNSRNVPLDFQFYPNLESGTFRSGYNGTSSTTFWTPNHEAMAEACSMHQQLGTDWRAPFSVSGSAQRRTWPRTCPHLGPGRKVDGNSWDRLRLAAKFSFNLVDRAKLLSYAMLASIDGFVERITMPT